jgi:hypothetical protein
MSTSQVQSPSPADNDATTTIPQPAKSNPRPIVKVRRAVSPKIYGYFVVPTVVFRAAQKDGTTVNNKLFETFLDWRCRLSAITGFPNNSRQFFPIDTPELTGYYIVLATNYREPLHYPSKELLDKVKAFLGRDDEPAWLKIGPYLVSTFVDPTYHA